MSQPVETTVNCTSTRPALWNEFLKAIRHEVIPALGCTEPVSLALASAIATRHLGNMPDKIEALVSPNLMKNGMGVTVPGTGMVGLPIAAAMGALIGDPDGELEVLRRITPESVITGKQLLADGRVTIGITDVPNILYAEVRLTKGPDKVRVCIADSHTQVVRIEKNGDVLFATESQANSHSPSYNLHGSSLHDVFTFAMSAPFADIAFILEAEKLNWRLSQEGLSGNYGLHIGATLQRNIERGWLSGDLQTRISMLSAAASDARMGGASLPAMSNSGSGNQGIAATLPVVVVAQAVNADEEKRARALMLSHLVAVYIHDKLPRLSALCAVTTAAMGSAAGMAWLLGGNFETISRAICSMIGDLAGMICDGASNSCAMKVSTSANSAYKAVLMALDNSRVSGMEGIVADSVEDSITNLCSLASEGMAHTDHQIIRIMIDKAR